MTDHILTLHVTEEQRQKIETQARESGYATAEAYLLALVEADEDDFIDDPEEAAIDLVAQFREAWHDAMTDGDNARPLDEILAEARRELGQDDHKS